MKFDFVPFHAVATEIVDLIPIHNQDVTEYGAANVDWSYYLSASKMGQCSVVTARDDGKLVGYSVFTFSANPMHKDKLEANNDALFVMHEYRGSTGLKILKKSDEYLKAIGIKEVNYLLKDDRIGKLLSRNGYKTEHKLWSIKYE